jgi:hypothetical protein
MEHKNTRKNRAEAPAPIVAARKAAAAERLDKFVCAALSTLREVDCFNDQTMAMHAVRIAKAAIKEIDNV